MKRVIFKTQDKMFRILEVVDQDYTLEDLKGDTFDYQANPDIPLDRMRREEREFEELVEREGVYGYVLERWNPAPGMGYEHVDSCFGFVGQYTAGDETFDHYIVDELKGYITGAPRCGGQQCTGLFRDGITGRIHRCDACAQFESDQAAEAYFLKTEVNK